MTLFTHSALFTLVGGVVCLLVCASAVGWSMSRCVSTDAGRAMADNINARIRAWWMMAAIFALAVTTGRTVSIALFGVISLLAFREFVTLAPTTTGDHRALIWSFFIVTPLQYFLVWIQWYGLFSVLIPVYVFMLLAIRTALAGNTEDYLQRTATHQWGLMICVYFVSYVPALLMLRIPAYEAQAPALMFFLVLVVQLSDVMQYVWGKTIGRHRVVPALSPNKTWEGLLGGVLSATALGTAIWWATPFSPVAAGVVAFIVTVMGFAGGVIMSAIKRDRGVKDYGTLLPGHGGILDRIDSLCFAAPIFFHLTRYFYVP